MENGGPSANSRERIVGRTLNNLIARAPWLWPLVRAPMRRFFDARARGWDERTGAGSPAHLAPLAAATLHVDPPPERALDLGCGTGEGTLFLAREFPHAGVRGVDISESMIEMARKKVGLDPEGRIAFRVADAASLPYNDDSFDLVAQLNMPPFFAETARVLRPGGWVILAASWGSSTPFFTPAAALERGFSALGIQGVTSGEAGSGTFWIGRQ